MPGAKVGGVGDVIRDLPAAVDKVGWPAVVLTPSYGRLHLLENAREIDPVMAGFRGQDHSVGVYEIPHANNDVRYIVLDHAFFVPTEPGIVYHDDTGSRPYATDADKFAFFSSASAAWIDAQDELPAAVHLHDWHAGIFAVLREFDPRYARLKQVPIFFTVHNLSYQGQRPLRGDLSSLEAWFPDLDVDEASIGDPHAEEVVNPMAAAIRLADRVNAVSPTYAEEIQRASDPEHGFIGGEGLENELARAAADDRLVGILNGCYYDVPKAERLRWAGLLKMARSTVCGWLEKQPGEALHELALERLSTLGRRRPLHVLTSVGRVVDQKMRLMLANTASGTGALEQLLENLGSRGVVFLLGSGEKRYEQALYDIARRADNLVFLRGYAEEFGAALYDAGDLFLMPSSFEPCGISQMLAMRAGQPCVVHGVGGLRDTVEHGVTGFVFGGDSPSALATNFVSCVDDALTLRAEHPIRWQRICTAAREARFDWKSSAEQYVELLYDHARH